MSHGGNSRVSNVEILLSLGDFHFTQKIEKYKENRKEVKGDVVNQKGKKGGEMVRIKVKIKITERT